jgi:hypothetical protein
MRNYLEKGPEPRFAAFDLAGAAVRDRVPEARQAALRAFAEGAPAALPSFCRPNVLEMVDLSRDEEQSLYRVLTLEEGGGFRACVGFGIVFGCEDTYDFFGALGADPGWALSGVRAWAQWLRMSGARLARVELDAAGEQALQPLAADGFAHEGTLEDFYGRGVDQALVVWRPARP